MPQNPESPNDNPTTTASERVTCPECYGSGESGMIPVFAKTAKPGHVLTATEAKHLAELAAVCHFCSGDGRVDAERLEWRSIGQQWRAKRRSLNFGLREWSVRVGCLPTDYCRMENGTMKPDERFMPRVLPPDYEAPPINWPAPTEPRGDGRSRMGTGCTQHTEQSVTAHAGSTPAGSTDLELPNSEGFWKREDGKWRIVVCQTLGRMEYTGWRGDDDYISGFCDGLPHDECNVLPRGGWVKVEAEPAGHNQDTDWVLAIGHALGLDSGFEVPIVPEVEPFKRLFAAIADRAKAEPAGEREELGEFVRIARLLAGWGMREFAEKVGILPSRYCNFENA